MVQKPQSPSKMKIGKAISVTARGVREESGVGAVAVTSIMRMLMPNVGAGGRVTRWDRARAALRCASEVELTSSRVGIGSACFSARFA